MKKYHFKYALLMLGMICLPTSASTIVHDTTRIAFLKYGNQRVDEKYTGWKRLCPTLIDCQYAGGMGMVAVGAGWEYGRHRQWETDFLIGFLPKKYSAEGFKLTFTIKQSYIPYSFSFSKSCAMEPFYCGLYFTTITGSNFWKKEPGKYPNGYYNFSTKVRPYIFAGERFSLQLDKGFIKHISIFYEISSCEMYIISKATNRSLRMKDILRISFGTKVHIFKD